MSKKVILTFPEDATERVIIGGRKFIKIDTGLTTEELLLALARYETEGDTAVIREESE
jgi:hypothetical protein